MSDERYHNEADIPGSDASADAQTLLAVESTSEGENRVRGVLSSEADTDWVAVELSEGTLYTLTVAGAGDDGLADSVLQLLDAEGNVLAMNDDMDAHGGNLGSQLQFAPYAGSGTQVYYVSVSAHEGHLGVDHVGAWELTVAETLSSADAGPDITGSELADKLVGSVAGETIRGLGGDDLLSAGHGDDVLKGGAGNDGLRGGPGADTLRGGDGFDLVYYLGSPAGVSVNLADNTASGGTAEGDTLGGDLENVVGSDYADMLSGDDQRNLLWGFGGDDVLQGGPGADVLTGNDGRDAVSYAESGAGVRVNLRDLNLRGGDADGDTFGNLVTVEFMAPATDGSDSLETRTQTVPDLQDIVGSPHRDHLTGDSRDNTILGGAGDDEVFGEEGDDVLDGGAGADRLHGGAGDDGLFGDEGDDVLDGGAGADRLHGGAGADLIITDADDSMVDGGAGSDTLSFDGMVAGVEFDLSQASAVAGIENLVGTAMADTLKGDDGDNLLEGFAGADDLYGGGGGMDTLSYEHSNRGVHVNLSDHRVSGGHAEGDLIDSFENVVGSAHNDLVSGSDAANRLWGLDGDDNLNGNPGDDHIEGGMGDDLLHGDAGQDVLAGGAGADVIYGGDNDDMLGGGEGADLLYGSGGDDKLAGGPGDDVFIFAPGNGDDVISDFEIDFVDPQNPQTYSHGDTIDLSAFDLEESELSSLLTPLTAADGMVHTRIDLSGHGGGSIMVHNDISVVPEGFLVARDINEDGDYTDIVDTAGVFIL